jgi:hypothetical protein
MSPCQPVPRSVETTVRTLRGAAATQTSAKGSNIVRRC